MRRWRRLCCSCSPPGPCSGWPGSRSPNGLSRSQKLAELAICDLAAGACLVIGFGWRRLSVVAFQLLLALGTVVITAGTYFASGGPTDTEIFYIWVALYAAFFFSRRQAAVQIAFVGVCYAGVLALGSESGEEGARWLITMGSVVVTALLFGYIKQLLDRRLAEKERSERELEESLSLQHATLESTADGILVVDRGGRMVSFNQRFKEMWRIPAGDPRPRRRRQRARLRLEPAARARELRRDRWTSSIGVLRRRVTTCCTSRTTASWSATRAPSAASRARSTAACGASGTSPSESGFRRGCATSPTTIP